MKLKIAILAGDGIGPEIVEATKLVLESTGLDIQWENVIIGNDALKEFDLILFLMKNPGRVYSREALLDLVWGYEYQGDTRTVDVHIRRLREKLELDPAHPDYIATKWGVGYYFSEK